MHLNRKQLIALAVGGSIMAAVGTFYLVKTKTSFLQGLPIHCKTFKTADPTFPGEVQICILSVTKPFAPENGDVELELTFKPSPNERTIVDATVWIADDIEGEGDYQGEINYNDMEIYEHNLLVFHTDKRFSAWYDPVVPKDVHIPMWEWIKTLKPAFDRPKLSFEDKFRKWMDQFVELGAMSTTVVVTAWKVFKGTTIE
jgi:hypothetical protein